MSILSNNKVIVRPVINGRPFLKKGHDGEFMFTGCNVGYKLPYDMRTRSFKSIFTDKEEQEEFEKLLNKQPGELNIYDWGNKFWSKFTVELTKDGKVLDLSLPIHVLELKVLQANKDKIAMSESTIIPGAHKFVLVDEGAKKEADYRSFEKNEQAMELYFKLRKSDKKMYDILRVLGKNPTQSMASNTKALKSALDAVISQKEAIKGQSNIDDFILAAEDPKLNTKVFVLDAIELGDVAVKNGGYRIKETDQLIGNSLAQSVDYFDDPKNQDQKLLIQQRLELNN